MTEESKKQFKSLIIGIFTGGFVAAPITAFVTKRIYDNKMDALRAESAEKCAKAVEKSYDNGLNDMAVYSQKQREIEDAVNNAFDEPMKEEDYEEEAPDPREHDISIEEGAVYSDMVSKYDGSSELGPMIIDATEFEMNRKYEKNYVNWYTDDNIFEEELKQIDDPYYLFGVTDGKELFKNADDRKDSNVCYIRNFKTAEDFEITRVKGLFSEIVGGEHSLGETNS